MDLEKAERAKARLTFVATVATAGYLILLACYAYPRWDKIFAMDPNNFGDFLAGAFGPLALFWFVVGYFQQGQELSQNTQALLLQHKEMQESVQQAKELVETAKREQEASQERWIEERWMRTTEKAVKLVFSEQTSKLGHLRTGLLGNLLTLKFRNFGGDAVNLAVATPEKKLKIFLVDSEIVERRGSLELVFEWYSSDFTNSGSVEFAIGYTDSDGDDIEDLFVAHGAWNKANPGNFVIQPIGRRPR